jgi:hypothetical protein
LRYPPPSPDATGLYVPQEHGKEYQKSSPNQMFLNTQNRSVSPIAAIENQATDLGFETDLGATFQWDEYFQFRLQTGVWLPGSFYKFSNFNNGGVAAQNSIAPVYAVSASVGVNF